MLYLLTKSPELFAPDHTNCIILLLLSNFDLRRMITSRRIEIVNKNLIFANKYLNIKSYL